MEAISKRFSSARFQRMLFWLGAGVLALGVVFFIVALGNRSNHNAPEPTALQNIPRSQIPTQDKVSTNAKLKQVDPAVFRVAREFIRTAVERKHLGQSWSLVLPSSELRQGFTRKQWLTGSISVVPFQDAIINEDLWQVEWLGKRTVQLTVTLSPGPHSQEPRTLAFHIGLTRVGKPTNHHWLVDYWGPVDSIVIPNAGG